MVGPPRGPSRPPMAPQTPGQPHHQIILKQVTTAPFTMIAKPATANYVNYLSLPLSNGSYLTALGTRQPDTNGTSALTLATRPNHVTVSTATTFTTPYRALPDTPSPSLGPVQSSPHSHQYLIPKPEVFHPPSPHNIQKSDPGALNAFATPLNRRSPALARPTNHQRLKNESEDEEGEEVRPRFDPGVPFKEQMVRIEHNYPQWLASPSPKEDDKESTISSDEKVDHHDEGEETETAAEGEDSVTRCICNMEHDDGYMISCDQCYVWQHVACVLPETTPLATSLPDMAYLCDLCQPRPLDRPRARALQMQRRKQILRNRQETSDDSDASSDRPPPKKAVARRRAEPIVRKPSKRESTDGLVRPAKLPGDTPVRNKLVKLGAKARRDSLPSPTPPSPIALRKNKLKRKFEKSINIQRKFEKNINIQRRKSKSKEGEVKSEVEEEKPQRPVEKGLAAKTKCRLSYSSTGEKMVVATSRIASGDLVSELRGKYLPQGSSPKVEVMFRYRLPKDGTQVLLDGSMRENVVRYANRSCTPNTLLQHAMVKANLRLQLLALETIEKNQEITIPHGCVMDGFTSSRECCGKQCTYNPNESPTSPRRRSRRTTMSEESDREGDREAPMSPLSPTPNDRKLTREEKKIEQAMKIFAAMEKETARKRERIPGSSGFRRGADSDKESAIDVNKLKRRKKRRKRRNSRKSRTESVSGSGTLLSGDDSDLSSGEEGGSTHDRTDALDEESDAAGLLLALGGHVPHSRPGPNTPPHHHGPRESHDHSENDSSPSTPMSSACLLVAAAVGPLAPGFKFPKTKKGMANDYQEKCEQASGAYSPAPELEASHHALPPGAPKLANICNRLYYPPRDTTRDPFAGKKRWLRWQPNAGDAPVPLGSPPCPPENVTPLKKRRMARESLTSEPATPEPGQTPSLMDEDMAFGEDSPKSPNMSADGANELANRVRAMQRDYLAQQGIEPESDRPPSPASPHSPHIYKTSPQQVPENLTVRPVSLLASSRTWPTSPPIEIRPPTPPAARIPSPLSSPRLSLSTSPSPEAATTRRGRKRPTARVEPCAKRPEPDLTALVEKDVPLINGEADLKMPPNDPPAIAHLELSIKEEAASHDLFQSLASEKPGMEHSIKIELFDEKPNDLGLTDSKKSLAESNCSTDAVNKNEPFPAMEAKCADPVKIKEDNLFRGSNMDLLVEEATKELERCTGEDDTWAADRLDKDQVVVLKVNKVEDEEATRVAEAKAAEEAEKTKQRRKLSITEYLKRKKGSGLVCTATVVSESAAVHTEKPTPLRPASPVSDDDTSALLMATPTLPSLPFMDSGKGGRFKEEPTELERQRENLNERLRREFGLAISDDDGPKVGREPPLTPILPPFGMPVLSPSVGLEAIAGAPRPLMPVLQPPAGFPREPPLISAVPPTNGLPDNLRLVDVPVPPSNGFKDDADLKETLPQNDIYPVGCSNPPNPFVSPYPPIPFQKPFLAPTSKRRKFRK